MVERINNAERKINASQQINQNASAMLNDRTIELNFIRNKLQKFQDTILKDVKQRMENMIEDVMQEIRQSELQAYAFRNFAETQLQQTSTWSNRVALKETNEVDVVDTIAHGESKKNTNSNETTAQAQKQDVHKKLPEKIFLMRESYLTALLQVDHMKTIYHIFYIIMLTFLMNSICFDYFTEGRVNFGLGTFKSGLAVLDRVFVIWLLEHVFVFAVYYAFRAWANVRTKLHRQPAYQSIWSYSCLFVYITTQIALGCIASMLCLKYQMPFVTASVLLLETTRLLMKMHAFVRTNAPRIIAGKLKTDTVEQKAAPVPPFSCYLYFLFAPTLLYRDSYPRTKQLRWKFAFARFSEVVAIAFLYAYIYERHIKLHYQHVGLEELNASSLLIKFFGMLMPSVTIFLCGFYLILHSWLNFAAEILRFGDRMFYKDWWTASNFDAYYRNWNVVVHDWLYEFIYKEFYNHVFKGSKMAASFMVFLVSAAVHEIILGFALQLFFPVMFLLFFVLSFAFILLTRKFSKNFGNIFLWFTLIFGNGLMISLYCMEYFARLNCPKTYNTTADYLLPALLECYKK